MKLKLPSYIVSLALLSSAVPALCQDKVLVPGDPPLSKPERVPDSSFENGKPQGIFVGRSLLSGKAICFLFLDGGRITRAIPETGLENFYWEQHKKEHLGDCGTYTLSGQTLSIRWGDGGVNTGPLTATPNGIEFYNKRYTKPETISVERLVGSWQAALSVGDITMTHDLEISLDGSFHWQIVTGGAVPGKAVANTGRDLRGKMAIHGLSATFKGNDGSVLTYTLLPVPGEPMQAFALGRDMFTRK
jgi:hypothetical protein